MLADRKAEGFPAFPAVCWRSREGAGDNPLPGFAGTAGAEPMRVDYTQKCKNPYFENKVCKVCKNEI